MAPFFFFGEGVSLVVSMVTLKEQENVPLPKAEEWVPVFHQSVEKKLQAGRQRHKQPLVDVVCFHCGVKGSHYPKGCSLYTDDFCTICGEDHYAYKCSQLSSDLSEDNEKLEDMRKEKCIWCSQSGHIALYCDKRVEGVEKKLALIKKNEEKKQTRERKQTTFYETERPPEVKKRKKMVVDISQNSQNKSIVPLPMNFMNQIVPTSILEKQLKLQKMKEDEEELDLIVQHKHRMNAKMKKINEEEKEEIRLKKEALEQKKEKQKLLEEDDLQLPPDSCDVNTVKKKKKKVKGHPPLPSSPQST